jgi:sulfur-oxidizing protein SoxB
MGDRIDNLTLRGGPLDASRTYKVASWAPVAEGASGKAIWDVVIPYLRAQKVIKAPRVNRPALVGIG